MKNDTATEPKTQAEKDAEAEAILPPELRLPEPTFTQGPWVVKHDKQGLPFIGVASDPWTYQGTVATVDTGAGDARLIAAAPELHAQAKILERLLTELAMQGETGTDEALEEVRAVLAKVDGGEG